MGFQRFHQIRYKHSFLKYLGQVPWSNFEGFPQKIFYFRVPKSMFGEASFYPFNRVEKEGAKMLSVFVNSISSLFGLTFMKKNVFRLVIVC